MRTAVLLSAWKETDRAWSVTCAPRRVRRPGGQFPVGAVGVGQGVADGGAVNASRPLTEPASRCQREVISRVTAE
ncbi:hypothetical protein GCM10010240_63160 [Streptomyces griseoviridis]|nr:hypothetical protein GCM10010240_63160 [Streptomyces griseoviridis]